MVPNPAFVTRNVKFWAFVRYASQSLGYSVRKKKGVKKVSLRSYSSDEIEALAFGANTDAKTRLRVLEYLNYRARLIEGTILKLLMDKTEARREYNRLKSRYRPRCHQPLNKQKGKKRHPAYFTCMINMLTEAHLEGKSFEDNPGKLITITDSKGRLINTLSRRIDGAFPSLRNPVAIWEIKEYYGTKTFGSRVADAVYETQLDGYELRETEKIIKRKVKHYLFVDDRFTWWQLGRSYLCRLVDLLHMGMVDEVFFGREVLSRWPAIVKGWKKLPS